MKRILILLALFTSIVNAQTIGQYQIDNGLKSPHWINDSLNKRVRYTDSLGIYVTPKQLNDSLAKRVRYIDSLGIYVTPTQMMDSIAAHSAAIKTVTANYTATEFDNTILVDASGGAVTVTLPSPSGIAGRWYSIKKIDSSVNAVTVSGSIEGASSYTLALQYKYVRVQTDGSAWYIFGSN